MNIRLAEIVRNRLVVLFLLFFCSQNKYPDRDGAGTGEDRSEIIPHGSASKVGVGIFGDADHVINSDCYRIRNLKVDRSLDSACEISKTPSVLRFVPSSRVRIVRQVP